ncbi:hypothetical protein T310_0781 [Rasamsonia emersonii CBS 393.64]|uniref:Uncharacterized protein n=1 Tax=Rasamsonia emersonii (strain ATCC 16479 / CBS 393.64 / IMI 116815) TaxID=1408163 RepID=A0A0F4Z4E2_RASE3|nr:hypothetical protein T310_0781 [Rasamsonia emersonii CBS 393.64]KKA25190.1 hypothetical protein T310_0781 [Rasamsonia emersonii CBS 393.64]
MAMSRSKWIIFLDAHRCRHKRLRGDRIESDDAAASCPAKYWLQEAANLRYKTAIPAPRHSRCGNTGFGQRREETTQSQLEEQRPVDGSRVVSESEEQKQADASSDGDPTVKADDAAGGNFDDRIPSGTVHSTPRKTYICNGSMMRIMMKDRMKSRRNFCPDTLLPAELRIAANWVLYLMRRINTSTGGFVSHKPASRSSSERTAITAREKAYHRGPPIVEHHTWPALVKRTRTAANRVDIVPIWLDDKMRDHGQSRHSETEDHLDGQFPQALGATRDQNPPVTVHHLGKTAEDTQQSTRKPYVAGHPQLDLDVAETSSAPPRVHIVGGPN